MANSDPSISLESQLLIDYPDVKTPNSFIMADSTPKSYSLDPTLWLYTSLTAGSSQIITATSRLEGILKANKIPFQALDVATDEKARMLWGRRAGKRKLPGLVRQGMIIGVCLPIYPLSFSRSISPR